MLNISRSEMKSEEALFQANERQVNATVCKYLAMVFVFFPVMLLLNVAGLFKFSSHVQITLICLGSFCTVSPFVLSKFIDNQAFLKYYILICVIVLTSTLGTEYYVGIYMTFMVAPIISCMYFDRVLTSKTILLAYLGYLISYFFRAMETRDRLYPGESVWETYVPLAAGFTIEFMICFVFLFRLAERAHFFLMEQRRFINEIEKEEAKLQMVLNVSDDIIFEYHLGQDVYTSNGSIRDWEKKDVEIKNFLSFARELHWNSLEVCNVIQNFLSLPEKYGNHHSGRVDLRFEEGGREYGGWVHYELTILRNSKGRSVTILGKLRDVTEERLEEVKAQEAKKFDALTGMYYYASLRKIIHESEIMNDGKMHQLMIVHLKNYREIGECYGEIYRDFVVMNAAEVMKEAGEAAGALTCRLSPSVFLIYLEDSESVDSRAIRQNLNNGLRELYVGEKSVDKLEYDFGYYLGEERIDDLFTVVLGYINVGWQEEGILEENSDRGIVAVSAEKTYHEIAPKKRAQKSQLFLDNISTLMIGAKDWESTIQIAMARIGKFYQLDGIRIYPIMTGKQSVNALFHWAVSDGVRQACDMFSLNRQVRDFFVENFGHSRIADNTIGAFIDFFRQFGENPLLVSGYSSLICPVVSEDVCRAILVYDIAETDFSWSDELKGQLLQVSKILGNSLLMMLDGQSIQDRDTLLSQMSYEIRMPMNVLFEMTEIARTDLKNWEHVEKCLDLIDTASQDMYHMVNHILDLSKIELAAWQPVNEIFSLEDVLAKIEDQSVERSQPRQINLLFERQFQKNLLWGDSEKISRVLSNLMENSIRFTDQGGEIHLLVQEIDRDESVAEMFFMVQDHGVPISQREIDKISDLLENGKRWNLERDSRIGLDVMIACRYVEMMGGQLDIESSSERGTRFTFQLAMEIPENENMIEFLSNQKRLGGGFVDLTGKTILLAEDDAMNAEIVKRLLEKHGAAVEIASNGRQCLDLFQSGRDGKYDLILMDILMPILDGHQVARAIRDMEQRKDAKSIPIIALSATAFEKDRNESLAAGMNAHLVKPIHVEEVMREMGKYLAEDGIIADDSSSIFS